MSDKIVRVGVAVAVYRRGMILLGRRKGSHGAGTYSMPGGHIEFGETPLAAACRELKEEVGLEALTIERDETCPWAHASFPDEGRQYVTLFFVARVRGEPELMEPEKCEGWGWYSPLHPPMPLFAGVEAYLNA